MKSITLDEKNYLQKLVDTRRKVEHFLSDRNEDLLQIRNAKQVDFNSVIDFAVTTSRTLRAPPHWLPGNPIIGGFPPAPQVEHMRLGKLSEFQKFISIGGGTENSS